MPVCTGLLLPLKFDPIRLTADLGLVRPEEWAEHYNERDYGGEWRGVALRSANGQTRELSAGAAGFSEWRDTELLGRCSYFREILSSLECPVKSVRLLSLAPGSFIREHSDAGLGYEDGEVRIHIPIQTNDAVEFYSAGKRIPLREGNCYYVNVSLPHRVANRGSEPRIHLVIDADVNEWVQELFRTGQEIPDVPPAKGSFEHFRHHVLGDPELQRKLNATTDRPGYTELCVQLGRELGFHFEAFDVGTTASPNSRENCRIPNLSKDWIPVSVHVVDGNQEADWIYLGDRRFTEPFFEDTTRIARRTPFVQDFRQRAPIPTGSGGDPSGFIFHMSRCGSTLLSRMFSAISRIVMLSEAPPIDQALSLDGCLQPVVRALGQPRIGTEDHYIVKLDAWHVYQLPQIRAAFPNTPWIFLYRNPLEVLVSQVNRPGRLGAPGAMDPAALRMPVESITNLPREEWCAEVLHGFLTDALQHRDVPGGMFINYTDLPDAMGDISAHFGIRLQDGEAEQMYEAAKYDAKAPAHTFQNDSTNKRNEASAFLRSLTASKLDPLYQALEAWRAH